MKFAELLENSLDEMGKSTVIGQAGTQDKAGKMLKSKGVRFDSFKKGPYNQSGDFLKGDKKVAVWDATSGSITVLAEDEGNLGAMFGEGDKVSVDISRFRSGRDPGRRRESYSGIVKKMGEDSCVVEFDKAITIKGKKVLKMNMKHAYVKPLEEAEPGDGAPTMTPGEKSNKGKVKDHADGSIKEAQSGAGAPTIKPGDKQNKGNVDDKTEKDVAGTTVVGEDISDQEKSNKGSIVTGKKGAKFAVAVNEAIG